MPLPKIPTSDVPREGGKRVASRAVEVVCDLPSKPGGLISAGLKAKALLALEEGLDAVRPVWNKDAAAFVMEPDFGTRTKCAEIVLAYAEGKPVERQVKLTGDFTGYDKRLEALVATPEGLRIAQTLGLIAEKDSQKREKSQKAVNERVAESQ